MYFKVITVLVALSTLCDCQQQYQKDALVLHNQLRAKHSSQKMTLDGRLNDLAVKCAGEYAASGDMDHHCANDYNLGENIHWQSNSQNPSDVMKAALKGWYDKEKPKYSWNKPGYQPDAGHFTQVIWDASIRLGCGVDSSRTYGVCLYDPRGNMNTAEAFKKNVKKG